MTRRQILALLGNLFGKLGVAMAPPLLLALWLGESAWPCFAAPLLLGLAAHLIIGRRITPDKITGRSFGVGPRVFLFVVVAWGGATVFAALPYVLWFGPGFVVNAIFESASGLSTTGATIFGEVESLPKSLLLWRALTQWIGGLGIVILFVWVLGRARWGVDVLSAEAPGPTPEKTEPGLRETSRDTVLVGAVLTAVLAAVLIGLGVPTFDAVCHSLTTLATGGFSTRNGGVGEFEPAVQWVIVLFMALGGVRFAVHLYGVKRLFALLRALLRRLRRPGARRIRIPPRASYFRDPELRLYVGVLSVAATFLAVGLVRAGVPFADALRDGAFQAVSVVTTSGFHTADWETWSGASRMLILVLMFAGGCAGSTAGSIKILRWLILMKRVPLGVRAVSQPHTEFAVHVGRSRIPEAVSGTMGEFVFLFAAVAVAGGLAIAAMGVDPLTAFSASAASVTNVGPALGAVGPSLNYGGLPGAAKILLALLMIAGRLEILTVGVLLSAPIRAIRARLRSRLA